MLDGDIGISQIHPDHKTHENQQISRAHKERSPSADIWKAFAVFDQMLYHSNYSEDEQDGAGHHPGKELRGIRILAEEQK